jgi:ERCC4-type nuclease
MHTHNIVYIIEGMYSQLRTENEKKRCLSAMTSLSYYKGFSVVRTCSVFETAEWIYSMASKIQKEHAKGGKPAFGFSNTLETQEENTTETIVQIDHTPKAYCEVVQKVKKENITPENIGEIILCTIPGISSTSAMEIMKHYSSFSHFMEEIKSNPEKLEEIYLSTNGKKRKLGKNIIENIIRYLGARQTPLTNI